MSFEHEWALQAQRRANEAHNKAFGLQQRLIRYQAAHRSLSAHLRMAAKDLEKTRPLMSVRYLEVVVEWEKFCEEPQASFGEVAPPTPGGSADKARSGAVSETAAQLESTEALSVSDRSSCLPPAVQYAGNWDDCALMRKQAE